MDQQNQVPNQQNQLLGASSPDSPTSQPTQQTSIQQPSNDSLNEDSAKTQQLSPMPELPTINRQQAVGQNGFSTIVPPKQSKLKIALFVLAGVLLLGAGSAAAYFGVIVPNKPENILKTAVKNSVSQKNVTSKVSVEGKDIGKDYPVYQANIITRTNREKKNYGIDASLTISGFTVSGEALYLEETAYVKIGGLRNITDLAGLIFAWNNNDADGQEFANKIQTIANNIANQWFEVDNTILKEAELDCALQVDLNLSDSDYQLLYEAYSKNPFITINSVSSDTVNGKATTKFELTLDAKKVDVMNGVIEKTSLFKNLSQCFGQQNSDPSSGYLDEDITNKVRETTGNRLVNFTLWVDRESKIISQITANIKRGNEKQGNELSAKVTFDYSPVVINKPEDSKPITTLLSEVMQRLPNRPGLGGNL